MDDRFNTIAGWVLFAGIVALGSSIVAGELFHSERPEKMGYPIAGVQEEGEGGGRGRAADRNLSRQGRPGQGPADLQQVHGAATMRRRAVANQLGPNLWGVVGAPIGEGRGFAFSDALSKKGGTWNWDNLSQWLTSPRTFAPGTKMTFAGLGSPQDRADVIAFLNTHSDAPKPLPAAPAPAAAGKEPGTGPNNGPQKAEKEPVLTEQQTGANPKNVGGPGAPKVAGPASVKTNSH